MKMKTEICKECGSTFVPGTFLESRTSKCTACLNKTRCKAMTLPGRQCSKNSTLDGYCLAHYHKTKKLNGKNKLKGGKK